MSSRDGQKLARWFHQPTITPAAGSNSPGQQPTINVIGSNLVAEMTLNTSKLYRIFKVPNGYISDPSFHIHWTKSGDADESTKVVLWRVSYDVWPGEGQDIAAAAATVQYEDSYDDAGTTTRVVHRTANMPAVGFLPNYYVGICVEAITPAGVAMASAPALLSCDLVFREKFDR